MRKGTSALGTDVPSEREINRLAARSEEEFWLFEKMDEERRQRENYRSRLMEEHEVPFDPEDEDLNVKGNKGSLDFDTPVTGKRHRKEVIREDAISDSQWMKAVENGNDGSKHIAKRRRENPPLIFKNETSENNVSGEKKVLELKSETGSMVSEAKSEDTSGWISQRSKFEGESSRKRGLEAVETGLNGLTWKAHKRKRSSLV